MAETQPTPQVQAGAKLTDNSASYEPMPAPKLVPIVMLIGEAGLGLRKNEIRGETPELAEKLIAQKYARELTATEKKTGKVEIKAE